MLTVLIATYNGARTLPDVLDAYSQLESPEGGWRLVIVDNGSTDQTKEIIASFHHRLPLTYLFEPRRGKNVALNAGLSSVSGDLIVFTDDDVLPKADWLKQLRSAVDSQPSFSIFGGSVLPKWESHPEDWILNWVPLSPTFAILDSKEGPITPHLIFGPNMAIRANIFQRGHRFDETLGPKGSDYCMGGETEFNLRLTDAGFTSWHCKGAVVYHLIRSFQMTEDWILNRAIRYGRAKYRREMKNVSDSPSLLLRAIFLLPWPILIQYLRVLRSKWKGDSEKAFKRRWQLNYLKGRVLEARLMRKSR